ncbi:MAG: SUMF1/EgtB/PvdO family nonheme iron enzyme [Chitinophagales bacterium]|nr:SUMF1/EgtB/PvdO family nonheme iron enzyme [Chitinophagales bacterium]
MRSLFFLLVLVGAIQPANSQVKLQSQDRALLFAVNDYQYMVNLNNPAQNARDIAAELEKRYGFQVEVVINPTIDEIDDKIDAYQKRFSNGTYPADGQLFLYFSGHGVQEDVNGYFMASDSDPARPQRTAMEYDYYRSQIDQINCQHILVAIDACHSATFDPSYGFRNDNRRFQRKGEEAYDRILANHKSYRARCFWTSDGQGEETPDRSTFAYQLLEGLRSHIVTNGYLRSSELFSVYLEKANPLPGGGDFGSDEPAACFLFFQDPSDVIDPEEQRFWELAKQKNIQEAYAFYLQLYPDGQYKDQATKSMQELLDSAYTTNPIEKQDELPEMIFVKGDTFNMGSQDGEMDEVPIHAVALSDFYIGRFEVTVEEFSIFIQATGYTTDAEKGGGSNIYEDGRYTQKEGTNWRFDATGKQRPSTLYNHPVMHVSWNDAIAYCNWLSKQQGYQPVYTISKNEVTANWNANGYRLPTEAEWEFAARSRGKMYKYAWGNGQPHANIADETGKGTYIDWVIWEGYIDGYVHTAPVGRFEQGDLGLSDMTGNVWEWCWDWYDKNYYHYSPAENPKGANTGSYRILRGGSWNWEPAYLRCANRNYKNPYNMDSFIGFRLSRTAQ